MASRGINKVILIGSLGKDPEVRYTPGGDAIVTLSLATSESWKDKHTGEKKELTEWHRVVFYGKPAQLIGEYSKKGSKLYVEGSLRTRKWQDRDGNDRYTTEIRGNEFQFMDSPPRDGSTAPRAGITGNNGALQQPGARSANGQSRASSSEYPEHGDDYAPPAFDDDIPF